MTHIAADITLLNVSALLQQAVIFLFDDLPDWQTLAAAAPEGAEVVLLDGAKDGLDQIAAHLQGRSGIDALHIVSHGSPGRLHLGSSSVGVEEVLARAEVLARVGDSLATKGRPPGSAGEAVEV